MADTNGAALNTLLENILNDQVPESPREATLARVAAGYARSARDFAAVTTHLTTARTHIESAQPFNWRDSLRANVELGMHLFHRGSFAEAVPVLERASEVLDRYFGLQNHGGMALQRIIERCRTLSERKAAGTCCGCGGCAKE